jgi:hypothetical protein
LLPKQNFNILGLHTLVPPSKAKLSSLYIPPPPFPLSGEQFQVTSNDHYNLTISNFWAVENKKCCFVHKIPFSYPTSPHSIFDPKLQTFVDSHCFSPSVNMRQWKWTVSTWSASIGKISRS